MNPDAPRQCNDRGTNPSGGQESQQPRITWMIRGCGGSQRGWMIALIRLLTAFWLIDKLQLPMRRTLWHSH